MSDGVGAVKPGSGRAVDNNNGSSRSQAPTRRPSNDPEAAIRAGLRVLRLDRQLGRPEQRMLSHLQAQGLALLFRGPAQPGPLPRGTLGRLPRDSIRYRAGEAMILHHLRLVPYVMRAKGYAGRGLEWDDVEQHGILGLIRALERWWMHDKARFPTYAFWWIRQAINRGIAYDSRTIRLPMHVDDDVRKVWAARSQLLRDDGIAPVHEIAARTGVPARRVHDRVRLGRKPVPLDVLAPDVDDAVPLIVHASHGADEIQCLIDQISVQSLLALVGERDAAILRLRFGLSDGKPRSLEEISQLLGITRERVRQLQERALGTIRKAISRFEHVEALAASSRLAQPKAAFLER